MRDELVYKIGKEDEGKSIAMYLSERGFSRRLIDDIKHTECGITVDGREVFVKEHLSCGALLRVKLLPEKDDEIVPQDIPLDIVYEDDDLLVIDKQAGMLVHPTANHKDGTLANALRCYFNEKNEPFTFRVVGRLDQDTSGLLIIPRHALSASILGSDVSKSMIHRTYIAIATGDVRDVFPSGSGVIDAPISTIEGEGMLRKVDFKNGKSARTNVSVICYDKDLDLSLCNVVLDTGRTHQIRVHFSYIGHPLPGAFLYNPDYRYINRQALHSSKISFHHPITKKQMSFVSPLPPDMRKLFPGADVI